MQIKKNQPIPPTSQGTTPIYPFRDMQVGDSLSLAVTPEFEKARRASASYARRHKGFVFTSRTGYVDGKKGKTGGTIWRVE